MTASLVESPHSFPWIFIHDNPYTILLIPIFYCETHAACRHTNCPWSTTETLFYFKDNNIKCSLHWHLKYQCWYQYKLIQVLKQSCSFYLSKSNNDCLPVAWVYTCCSTAALGVEIITFECSLGNSTCRAQLDRCEPLSPYDTFLAFVWCYSIQKST